MITIEANPRVDEISAKIFGSELKSGSEWRVIKKFRAQRDVGVTSPSLSLTCELPGSIESFVIYFLALK